MTVSATHLTGGTVGALATGITTASITPSSNALVLLLVAIERTGSTTATAPSSVTGNGLTWVLVGSGNLFDVTGISRESVFLYRAMGASPSSGAVTVTFGYTSAGASYEIDEFTGVDTSGTNGSGAIVQVVESAGTNATPLATLAAFSGVDNATYGGHGAESAVSGSPTGAGFTQLGTHSITTTITVSTQSEFKNSNDTTVDAGLSGSAAWGMIGVEIKALDATGTPQTFTPTFNTQAVTSPDNVATEVTITPVVNIQTGIAVEQAIATPISVTPSISVQAQRGAVIEQPNTDLLTVTHNTVVQPNADAEIISNLIEFTSTELNSPQDLSSDLTATVFTFPDMTTPDVVQPVWTEVGFQDILADAGSGSVKYPFGEDIPYGKLIQFAVKGVPAKTIFVSPYDRTAIDPNEEASEFTVVSGIEAQLDQLSKARAHPANGLNHMPTAEDRIGDYTDPYCYDDSDWLPANDLWSVGEAKAVWDVGNPDDPIIFDDLDARVLAFPGDTTTSAPLGTRYFRQAFTAPYDGPYVLEFGADDVGEFFIDGVPLASTDQRQNWTAKNIEIIELSSGTHIMAWSVTNMPWVAAGNAAGAAWSLRTPGIEVSAVVAHSDSSAKVYPAIQDEAPGMTAGHFMRCLIYEAIGSGFLTPFVLSGDGIVSWDDEVDSYGNPWPIVLPSTKVSTDLLTVFTKDLAPHVELWAEPDKWLLHAVVKGTKGGSSGVTLSEGDNITHLAQKGEQLTSSPGNLKALVRWGGGWTSVGSGEEETFIDLGAIHDMAEVIRVVTDQLVEFGQGIREQITVSFEPSDDTEIPYVTEAFETGATITVPDSLDTPISARIKSITVSTDDREERLLIAVEVGDVVLNFQERVNLQLKKMVF